MRGAQTRRTARSPLRARCAASPLLPSSCSSHPSPLLSLCPPLSPPPPPLLLCLPPPAPPSPLRDDLLRGIASSIPITFCSCQHAVPRCPRAPAAGLRSQGLRPPSDATARCEETLHFYCLSSCFHHQCLSSCVPPSKARAFLRQAASCTCTTTSWCPTRCSPPRSEKCSTGPPRTQPSWCLPHTTPCTAVFTALSLPFSLPFFTDVH